MDVFLLQTGYHIEIANALHCFQGPATLGIHCAACSLTRRTAMLAVLREEKRCAAAHEHVATTCSCH
eukprot:464897-Pelagomonas_calceolata.AAC.6